MKRLHEYEDFFARFESLARQHSVNRRDDFQKFFRDFEIAFKKGRETGVASTPHLNILRVFGLTGRELRHSRTIGWFLDPSAEHEQGSLFLNALLLELQLQTRNSENAIVQFEKPNRVDVAIYLPEVFAIFIENKVLHTERIPKNSAYRTIARLLFS